VYDPVIMKEKDSSKKWIKKKQFEQSCTRYMEEFGFEWVEEFTLNGA